MSILKSIKQVYIDIKREVNWHFGIFNAWLRRDDHAIVIIFFLISIIGFIIAFTFPKMLNYVKELNICSL